VGIQFNFIADSLFLGSWDYGLDDPGSIRSMARFSLHHSVQTSCGAQPASYQMGTGGGFCGGTAAGAWSWALTSIYWRGQDLWSYTSTPSYIFMA
jgi:hypothetical protein